MKTPGRRSDPALDRLWAVVPAGGAGTRLWPLSRNGHPKFLRDLTGSGRTLLQDTVARVQPLVSDRVLVVTGARHVEAVRRQLRDTGVAAGNVLAEPSPRDSMAAIGWAAAVLERDHPEAIIGSFAADHVIGDQDAFEACLVEATRLAAAGHLVTIGIEPTSAATGFGYIEMGEPLAEFPSARRVQSFVEKPDAERAAGYLAAGNYRWNAGMFLVGAGRLLDLLAVEHPDLAAGLRDLAATPTRMDEIWSGLRKIAIDHAVAEPAAAAGAVVCVPGTFSWDDVGDFAALAGLDDAEFVVQGDPALVQAIDATGLVLPHDRVIAVLGIEDVVVVDTGDAVLVTTLAQAQRVKELVTALKERGREDLT